MSLRDKFYYLGPAVKPRDDKKGETCSVGSGHRDDTLFFFLKQTTNIKTITK